MTDTNAKPRKWIWGHKWNHDTAKAAGLKGGKILSANKEHMARIGRLGGLASKGKKKNAHL